MKGIVLSTDPCGDLSILKNEIPKAMITIGNKPILDWIVRLLKKHGIAEVMATLHCYSEEIQDYFGDGSRMGLQMWYSQEPKLLGNAGSVKRVENFLGKDTFIAITSGILSDIDIKRLVNLHKSRGAIATLGLMKREHFGKKRIHLDNDGITVISSEKEQGHQSQTQGYRSCGIYVLEPKVLEYIPKNKFFDFEENLLPRLIKNNEKVCGFVHEGYWIDVNTFDNFKKANFDFLSKKIKIGYSSKNAYSKDGIRVGKRTEIHESVQIRSPVSIGNDCVIREDVRLIGPVVIGDNTIIDKDVSFQKAIMWGRGYIGRDSCVNGALIGDSTYISSEVEIQENTIIGLNCIVGPRSSIHEGALLNPGAVIKKNSTIDYTVGNKRKSICK